MAKSKKAPAKGKAVRVKVGNKTRSVGQKGKNPPCANAISRKRWKCKGKKSMK